MKLITRFFLSFSLIAMASGCAGTHFKYAAVDNPLVTPSVQRTVDELYARMSQSERIAQLHSMYLHELVGPDGHIDTAKCRERIPNGVGHFAQYAGNCNPDMSLDHIRDLVAEMQDWLMNNTPSGIPALFHEEVLSGVSAYGATIYPQQIGLACSFNIDLAEQKTRQTAATLRKIGGALALSPMVDVSRNPYFNRNEESYGEDGYLSAAMGAAFVRGLQYGGLENGIAACTKHFLGYGSGYLSDDKEMHEEILLPHEVAIRTAGSKVVMTGYHDYHGVKAVVNQELANGMLRGYLGFDGVMVSDYGSIDQFPIAVDSPVYRAAAAINAGNDIEFQNPNNYPHLQEAIDKGLVSQEVFEAAVKRVLALKVRVGLFDGKLYDEGHISFDSAEERETAYKLASQSVVLLKNNGVLPLRGENLNIALTGPNANQAWAMLGDYCYPSMIYFWRRRNPETMNPHISLLKEAMEAKLPAGWSLDYERGCDWTERVETSIPDFGDMRAFMMWMQNARRVDSGEDADWNKAIAEASESDVIVAAMGENVLLCGENRDRGGIRLPGRQEEFVEALLSTGKPVVLIMFGGRAQVIGDLADRCAAVIQAWYPGEEGGNAVADILYGNVNPSGKLSVSYPAVEIDENICYNYSAVQDPRIQYPFGYGLSYTSFEYSGLRVDRSVKTSADAVHVSFDVTNTGDVAGDEIVQIYLSPAESGQLLKPIQLQGFGRVSLAAGETKRMEFLMSPQQFGHYADGHWVIDPGNYILKVGASSQDIRLSGSVSLKGSCVEIPLRTVYFAEQQ